jgi:hypothetical protein
MSILALIRRYVETLEGFEELYAAFQSLSCSQLYEENLYAMHHACWSYTSTPYRLYGTVTSQSCFSFLLLALSTRPVDRGATLADFPLVRILAHWVHDTTVPITRMSLRSSMDLLLGLEWELCSDVLAGARTPEFLEQARELYGLVRNRLMFLLCEPGLPLGVLDEERYRTVRQSGLLQKVSTADLDYDSDDEVFGARVKRIEGDLSEFDVEVADANATLLFELDAIVTHLDDLWEQHAALPAFEPAGALPSLSTFRSWLFSKIVELDERETVKARREWVEALQMTPSYLRVYQWRQGGSGAPVLRQVLLRKHESLIQIAACSTLKDVLARQIDNTESMMRLATDALFSRWISQTGYTFDRSLIQHHRLRNTWAVKLGQAWVASPSFTHAFRKLRLFQGAEPPCPYDEHF